MPSDFIDRIRGSFGIVPDLQTNVLLTVFVVLSVWLIRRLLLKAVSRRTEDAHSLYYWRKTSSYLAFFFALLVLVRIWFEGFQSFSTVIGLVSAGIAIALKDALVNLAGWLFIIWRRPFAVGDRVQIGEVAGDVIDLRIFQFTLMEIGNWVAADQSTGRILHVPNGRVFTQVLANYSKGFEYIWDELGVLITFESDWQAAKEILLSIVAKHAEHLSGSAEQRVREASRKFMIFYSKLTPIVYTSVEASGVMLTLRYLTEPQKRRNRREVIWEDILVAFAKNDDIDFAYPTQRFYSHRHEGKAPVTVAAPPGPN